jgi:hypothetical protein
LITTMSVLKRILLKFVTCVYLCSHKYWTYSAIFSQFTRRLFQYLSLINPLNTKRLCFTQGDQNISVHLAITVQTSGAQRFFDHPVWGLSSYTVSANFSYGHLPNPSPR